MSDVFLGEGGYMKIKCGGVRTGEWMEMQRCGWMRVKMLFTL